MIYGVCNEVFEIQNRHCESSFQGSDFPFFEESELLLGHIWSLNRAALFSKDEILSKLKGRVWKQWV